MRIKNMLFMVLLLSLAGCSSLSVSSDYDTSANFASWRTYRWEKVADTGSGDLLASNPIVYRRVVSAVDRELAAKGFIFREKGPVDFTVSARAVVRELVWYEPAPVGWHLGYYRGRRMWYRGWWGEPWPTPVYYREGALLLDITDVSGREIAWRGAVSGLVDDYPTPERMQEAIDKAVRKLLAGFPPGRK